MCRVGTGRATLSPRIATLRYITLHCIALHYIALYYIERAALSPLRSDPSRAAHPSSGSSRASTLYVSPTPRRPRAVEGTTRQQAVVVTSHRVALLLRVTIPPRRPRPRAGRRPRARRRRQSARRRQPAKRNGMEWKEMEWNGMEAEQKQNRTERSVME